jgi:hypothetical protein
MPMNYVFCSECKYKKYSVLRKKTELMSSCGHESAKIVSTFPLGWDSYYLTCGEVNADNRCKYFSPSLKFKIKHLFKQR